MSADTVYRVFTSRLYALNCCVIETPDLVLVVDPGYLPDEIAAIRRYVDDIRKGRPLYLLLTHSDSDHIAGYGAFADALVIASQAFVDHPDREAAIEEVMEIDDDFYIIRPYPIVYPQVDLAIKEDGERMTVGGTTVYLYQAAGHNRDGLAALIEPAGLLLPGDYLSDLEFPFVTDSYQAYQETLDTLRTLTNKGESLTLIPCHGSITDNPAEIQRRLQMSEAYLALSARIATGMEEEAAYDRFIADQELQFPRFLRKQHNSNLVVCRNETTFGV